MLANLLINKLGIIIPERAVESLCLECIARLECVYPPLEIAKTLSHALGWRRAILIKYFDEPHTY